LCADLIGEASDFKSGKQVGLITISLDFLKL